MLKKIRIHIVSESFSAPGQPPERSEYTAEGHLLEDSSRFSLSYREAAQTGMGDCKTTLSFLKEAPETVYLRRSGQVKTQLSFTEGQVFTAAYEAPLVSFEVETAAYRVRNLLREEGLLELEYRVRQADADPEDIRFQLKYE